MCDSVYMEYIVSQETTRALVLFKVREVDHASKRIVLENVRRIFLPNWSCALMMLENKVSLKMNFRGVRDGINH
jgi:hypothetical protein